MKILQSSMSVWFTLWENFEEIEMTQKALLRSNGCIEVQYTIYLWNVLLDNNKMFPLCNQTKMFLASGI